MKNRIRLFYLINKLYSDRIYYIIIVNLGGLYMQKKDFDQIYKIMDESFPDAERRSYNEQFSLLEDEHCKVFVKRNEKGEIIIFFIAWIFDDFCFGEHLATDKRYRNLGLGSKFFSSCVDKLPTPMIIEVEPPENDIAKRRINLYKRLGFHLNSYKHKQPALQEHTEPCDLLIMSYPKPLSKKEFIHYRNKIFNTVYKTSPGELGLEN